MDPAGGNEDPESYPGLRVVRLSIPVFVSPTLAIAKLCISRDMSFGSHSFSHPLLFPRTFSNEERYEGGGT